MAEQRRLKAVQDTSSGIDSVLSNFDRDKDPFAAVSTERFDTSSFEELLEEDRRSRRLRTLTWFCAAVLVLSVAAVVLSKTREPIDVGRLLKQFWGYAKDPEKLKEAIPILEEVYVQQPKHGLTLLSLGAAHQASGNLEQARSFLWQAVDVDPAIIETRVWLASMAIQLERFDEAVAALSDLMVPTKNINFYPATPNGKLAAFRKACEYTWGFAHLELWKQNGGADHLEHAREWLTRSSEHTGFRHAQLARYNMACLEALENNLEAAAEHLTSVLAVPAIYESMLVDEDLEALREDERYRHLFTKKPKDG